MTLTKLTSYLWVGSLHPMADIERAGIKSVICLMSDNDYDGERIHIPMVDDKGNKPEVFIKVVETIDSLRKEGKTPILVHCRGGASRSVVATAFYLAAKGDFGNVSVREMIQRISQLHKIALPNQDVIDVAEDALIGISIR